MAQVLQNVAIAKVPKGPRWSRDAVTAAAGKSAYYDITSGSDRAFTGAEKIWGKELFANGGGSVPNDRFTQYFEAIRTSGHLADFSAVYETHIFPAYGANIRALMNQSGASSQMQAIYGALAQRGIAWQDAAATPEAKEMRDVYAYLVYSAFSPYSVNVEIKPSNPHAKALGPQAVAAVAAMPARSFAGQAGYPDLTANFKNSYAQEEASRKVIAKAQPKAEKIADPWQMVSLMGQLSIKNSVKVSTGGGPAAGVALGGVSPSKPSKRGREGLIDRYNKRGAQLLLVTKGNDGGIEEKNNGRDLVGASLVDMPVKTLGDYVYIAGIPNLQGVIARTTNPNYLHYLALAAKALTGQNVTVAQMQQPNMTQALSNISAKTTFVPGQGMVATGGVAQSFLPATGVVAPQTFVATTVAQPAFNPAPQQFTQSFNTGVLATPSSGNVLSSTFLPVVNTSVIPNVLSGSNKPGSPIRSPNGTLRSPSGRIL